MDKSGRQKLAAGIVISIAAGACICILAILAGSYVYLTANPHKPPVAIVVPTPEAPLIAAPTSAASVPSQVIKPFKSINMKADKATRTYTFTLTPEPGAHPAEIGKIIVNATHAGKDYGTVWKAGEGTMIWTKHTFDDGILHYGDELTITIDAGAIGIPMDNQDTQITFLYDGRAVFTQVMGPV